MEIRIIGEGHNPQEYEGLIFNMPKESIPIRLAREVARVGSMELWQYQSFQHHEHPFMDDDSFNDELQVVEDWKEMLSTRFPDYAFVIELRPTNRVTWYQATENAPKEDDVEFEDYSPPIRVDMSSLKELWSKLKDSKSSTEIAAEHRRSFMERTPRNGSVGTCEECQSAEGFSEPFMLEGHRGVRMITCKACGKDLIHSTRTIRFAIN